MEIEVGASLFFIEKITFRRNEGMKQWLPLRNEWMGGQEPPAHNPPNSSIPPPTR